MITTKRQIRKETDRFGGYGAESRSFVDFDDITNTEPPVAERENVGARLSDVDLNISNSVAQEQPQMYTTLVSPAPAPQQELPPRPKKTEQPRNEEDVLPTLKTRAYADDKAELEQKEATAPARRTSHRALDSRTKVLLCVYVAVALALAIAVIATGVSISTASAQADAIMGQIAQKQAVIVEQEATLFELRDDETIREHAIRNGMVQAENPTYSAPAAPEYDYPAATPHTNGFDEFFDWLYGIIG